MPIIVPPVASDTPIGHLHRSGFRYHRFRPEDVPRKKMNGRCERTAGAVVPVRNVHHFLGARIETENNVTRRSQFMLTQPGRMSSPFAAARHNTQGVRHAAIFVRHGPARRRTPSVNNISLEVARFLERRSVCGETRTKASPVHTVPLVGSVLDEDDGRFVAQQLTIHDMGCGHPRTDQITLGKCLDAAGAHSNLQGLSAMTWINISGMPFRPRHPAPLSRKSR
jgi:hypothetical protein